MSREQKLMTGSCLCGEIVYQVDKIEEQMAHCHCTMCRKFHGAAFSTFGEAKSDHFKWLKGEAYLNSFTAPNGSIRQFCKNCGSSMTFAPSAQTTDVIEFSLGTLDVDIAHKPDAHVFVSNKANWSHIDDSLPLFKQERKT